MQKYFKAAGLLLIIIKHKTAYCTSCIYVGFIKNVYGL